MRVRNSCSWRKIPKSHDSISIYLNEVYEKFKFIFDRKTIGKQEF